MNKPIWILICISFVASGYLGGKLAGTYQWPVWAAILAIAAGPVLLMVPMTNEQRASLFRWRFPRDLK